MTKIRILGALTLALFQITPTCLGQGVNLLYNGGANGTFSNTADWDEGLNPLFEIGGVALTTDSLTFGATPAGGATVNNDLDPATNSVNPGEGVVAALGALPDGTGTGTRDDSASFHFLDGSGDITVTGFPIEITSPTNAQFTAVRIEPNAGVLQTIDTDIVFRRNALARVIQLNGDNGGRLVLNGDIQFNTGGWFFGDTNLDSPAVVEFNGVGVGAGSGAQVANSWASGAGVAHEGNSRAQVIRINAGDLQRSTIEGANGTHIILGNSQALGDAHSGTWETDTLNYRFISSTRVERFNDGYADNNSFSVKSGVDLSEYGIQTVFGSNWNFSGENNTTVGWIHQTWGREDLNANSDNIANPAHPDPQFQGREVQPWGSVTVDGTATLNVASHGGIFVSFYDGAEQFDLRLPGTSGEVAGANGRMVIDGKLYNSFLSPSAQASLQTTATGGIQPGPKTAVGDANVSLFAKPGQMVAEDSSLVNGTLTVSYGTITLNGDSGDTWKGSQYRALNGSTTIIGHNNALGDAGSLISIEDDSIVDTGTHTVAQRFINTDGTIRGNGTLTNAADWSIAGTVQPGGETPTATDVLTFDFTSSAQGNTLAFESSSTVDFVLGAGSANSEIDVLGATGTTTVELNDNTLNFTDATAGSLTGGTYTLFDGDENTSFTLGAGVAFTGLEAYPGSTVSVSGDDIVLNLQSGGGGGFACDLDADGDCDQADIDVLYATNPDGDAINEWLTQASNSVSETYVLGDVNLDGDVNSADLGLLLNNFGSESGVNWGGGDLNADDNVDSADLGLLLNNFNFASSAATSAVPEPGSLSLLLLLGLAPFLRRVRRS